jgi:hypothetical protein
LKSPEKVVKTLVFAENRSKSAKNSDQSIHFLRKSPNIVAEVLVFAENRSQSSQNSDLSIFTPKIGQNRPKVFFNHIIVFPAERGEMRERVLLLVAAGHRPRALRQLREDHRPHAGRQRNGARKVGNIFNFFKSAIWSA